MRNSSNCYFSFPDGPERSDDLLWSDCPMLHAFTGWAAERMATACHLVPEINPNAELCKNGLRGFLLDCNREMKVLHLTEEVAYLLTNPPSKRFDAMLEWLGNGWDDDGAALVELLQRLCLNRRVVGAAISLRSVAISCDSDDSAILIDHSRS